MHKEAIQKEEVREVCKGGDSHEIITIQDKEPYEKGMEKGVEEGRKIEKIDMVLKFLTKRFGLLPDEIKEKVRKLDMNSLDIILDKVMEYKDLEDFKKFIHYNNI